MSQVVIKTEELEEFPSWEAEIANWKWDGISILSFQAQIQVFEDHAPGKLTEWQDTVPAEYRGEVMYVVDQNPTNSCEETRAYVEILAVDQSGNALVYTRYLNTYTDGEGFRNEVMPLDQAKAHVDEVRRLASAVER